MIPVQRRYFLWAACAVLCWIASVASIFAIEFRKVAITGQPAPGTNTSFTSLISYPSLNNSGQVAFKAAIDTDNPTTSVGIWSEGSGPLALIAQLRSQAPDAPAGALLGGVTSGTSIFIPILGDGGQVVFTSQMLIGQGGVTANNDSAVWTGATGSLSMFAREGTPAPGTSTNFGNLVAVPGPIHTAINSTGKVAFVANLQAPSTSDTGVWLNNGGTITLIACEGSPASGTSTSYGQLSVGDGGGPLINAAGDIVFGGPLQNGGEGIWVSSSGNTSLIAQTGAAAPGAPSGAVFDSINFPAINATGRIGFNGELKVGVGGVTTSNNAGIWSQGSAGFLNLVAREGTQAPGTPAGVKFSDFNSTNSFITVSGGSVFHASLIGSGVNATNGNGYWTNKSGSLSLIAREGNAAPGMLVGTVFQWLPIDFTANSYGQIAFSAQMSGPGITTANDGALWVENALGNLQLIVRDGDLFEVDPGVFKTIDQIYFSRSSGSSGGSDGLSRTFNDQQQLAFSLSFTDGTSGLFVATVPEPAAISLFMIGSVGLIWRARRKSRTC